MADSLKQKTIKGVSWSFVEQILTRGANFIIGIILARLLSPSEFGLIGMLGIFMAVSQIFIDGGLTSALIQQKNPSDKDYSTVFIINLTMSLVFYLLLFVFAPQIAAFYNQPILKSLVRAVGLVLIIGAVSSIQGTLLTIRVDFKTKSYISIIASLSSGIVGIVCAYRGMGVWSLVIQSLFSATMVTLMTHLFVRWMPRLVFSKESFHRLFSYSSKILAASLINVAYDNAYPMVIGKKFTVASVGEYTRASQFPGMANSTVISAMNRVAFPILSKVQDDDARLLDVFEKYTKITCFLVFPVLMGLCGCARPLVSLLLKEQWLDCVPLMQIICFSFLSYGLTQLNLNLLYVKGRSDLVLRLEIIKKSVAFAILFGSMFFGVKGMCYGQVLNALVDLLFTSFFSNKILSYNIVRQVKPVVPYLLASMVVLAEGLLASRFIANDLVSLLTSLVVCPLSYWLIAKFGRFYAYEQAMELVRPMLAKLKK